MKTILKIAVMICFVIAITDPVAAIDRSKKGDPNPANEPPPKEKTVAKQKQADKKTDSSRTKKNYDSFIDKNNNGINDQAEKKTVPSKTKKEVKKKNENPPSL